MKGDNSVADMLLGPEYFRCEKMRVQLRYQACIDRQELAKEKGGFTYSVCKNCQQGQEILKEKKKEQKMETPATYEPSVTMCKECGENPAMMRKDGKTPINGNCSACHSRKISGARKNAAKPAKKQGAKVVLDLSEIAAEYPEVMDALEKAATANMRPVAHQALFYIYEGISREGKI